MTMYTSAIVLSRMYLQKRNSFKIDIVENYANCYFIGFIQVVESVAKRNMKVFECISIVGFCIAFKTNVEGHFISENIIMLLSSHR